MMHALPTRRRLATHVIIGATLLLFILSISPGVGSQPIGIVEAWKHWDNDNSTIHYIAFQLRLARAVKAMVAGATLALCGAVYQTLFRNVLATPYTLGIASGGTLGALLAAKGGLATVILGLSAVTWGSLAGCTVVVFLVFFLASSHRTLTGNTLVLAGITVGLFCSAMMMFVTYLADVKETFFIVRWMMGSLDTVGHQSMGRILIPLVASWLVMLWCAPALNQFEMGDELAASRGVRPLRLQWLCVAFSSLGTALVVSICGPIGFVGLIVPQAARLLVGGDHRILLPTVTLWGAAFLIVCDWLTRLVPGWFAQVTGREVTAAPLPIGVMTAVIGAPVFVYLLRRHAMR